MILAQPFGPLHEGYDFDPQVAYVRQGDKVFFFRGTPTLTESVDTASTRVLESFDELALEERDGRKHVKDGKWVVEGPYQRSDVENANKRVYARSIWERIIADPNSAFMQNVRAGGVIGHLEHPKDGRTDGNEGAVVHRDFKLQRDGVVWGKSELLDTPQGLRLQEYTRKGVRWGISSRGNGSVDAGGKVSPKDFQLETFDAVMRPSTPGAYPSTPAGRVNASESAPACESVEDLLADPEAIEVVAPQDDEADAPDADEADATADATDPVIKGALPELKKRAGRRARDTGKRHVVAQTRDGRGAKVMAYADWKKSKNTHPKLLHTTESADVDAASTADRAVVEAVEAEVQDLIETELGDLDEAAVNAVASAVAASMGKVNELDRAKAVPRDKAHTLREWLTKKLNDIYHRVPDKPPKAAATAPVTEGAGGATQQQAAPADKRKDEAFRRVVTSLTARVAEAAREAADARESEEAASARADDAERRLSEAEALNRAAAARAAVAGERIDELERRLDAATGYVEEAAAGAAGADPVAERVDEAIAADPALAAHRDLLVRADSPEQVDRLAEDFASRGDRPAARALGTRTTLPSGLLLSEDVGARRPTPAGPANSGARLAARLTKSLALSAQK